MATKMFDNEKPLATVTIKQRVLTYEYRDYLLFGLTHPKSGYTHAVISEAGRCIAFGTVVEGNFECATKTVSGDIDGVYWE